MTHAKRVFISRLIIVAFGWGSYNRGEVYYRSGEVIPDKLVMHR